MSLPKSFVITFRSMADATAAFDTALTPAERARTLAVFADGYALIIPTDATTRSLADMAQDFRGARLAQFG